MAGLHKDLKGNFFTIGWIEKVLKDFKQKMVLILVKIVQFWQWQL